MANTFFGTARGKLGYGTDGITVGTSSTATLDFELRVANADQQGNTPTRKDVIVALETIKAFVLSDEFNNSGGFPPL